jgi:hypothetical protein
MVISLVVSQFVRDSSPELKIPLVEDGAECFKMSAHTIQDSGESPKRKNTTKLKMFFVFPFELLIHCRSPCLTVLEIYRVSQEECARLRENVPYVKVHQYNPNHLYPKLNGYGDNGEISLKVRQLLHTY